MIALSSDGKIYPCIRYKDYSLDTHEERIVGSVDTGIDMELVRPFMAASSRLQYCRYNFFTPVFVHGDGSFLDVDFPCLFEDHVLQHILPAELEEAATHIKHPMLVFTMIRCPSTANIWIT